MDRLLAIYGTGVVDPEVPLIHADDLGILRGDGVFEAWLLREGQLMLLDMHLDRLFRSAAAIDLALPDHNSLAEWAIDVACAWPRDVEAVQRLVCTRGRSSVGRPTVFMLIEPVAAWTSENRRRGVRLVTGTAGFPVRERRAAPWLLGGVKSLSYAINMASHRWGVIRGGQEMLWVSSDGYVLETPSFNLVWITANAICTVPGWTGIVVGTTGRALMDKAGELQRTAVETLVTPAELTAAEGVWLTGSLSGILAVTELDGRPLPQSPLLSRARSLIGYPDS